MSLLSNKYEILNKAINNGDIEKIYSISSKNKINFNKRDQYGECPLSYAFKKGNIEVIKTIINIADKNGILLELNERYQHASYLMLYAVLTNKIEVVNLLIEYANRNNIILEISDKDWNGNYPLLNAIMNNNMEMIKVLMFYAEDHKIVFKFLNEVDEKNNKYSPLLFAIETNNMEIFNLVINYANNHNITLDFNIKYRFGDFLLLQIIKNNNIGMMKKVIDMANSQKTVLNINEKFNEGISPIKYIITHQQMEMAELVINYIVRHENSITLDQLDKINISSYIFKNHRAEILRAIIDLISNDDILVINEKFDERYYPLLYTIEHGQLEMVELIVLYAHKRDITLKFVEDDITDPDLLDINILELLYKLEDRKVLDIKYSFHSKLYKIFKRIGKSMDDAKSISSHSSERRSPDILDLPNGSKDLEARLFSNNYDRNETLPSYIDNSFTTNDSFDANNSFHSQNLLNTPSDINNNDINSQNENGSEKINNTPGLTIAIYDFKGRNPDELNISKDDQIIVSNWNKSDGWAYGYKKNHPQEKGLFPSFAVVPYEEEQGDLSVVLYDFKGIKHNELNVKVDEYVKVLNWNFKDGWVLCYKSGKPQEKGAVPKVFVQKLVSNNIINNNTNTNISNNSNNNYGQSTGDDDLPTYEEAVGF